MSFCVFSTADVPLPCSSCRGRVVIFWTKEHKKSCQDVPSHRGTKHHSDCTFNKESRTWRRVWSYRFSLRIHVWYIYLHLVDFYGKCRQIYHTWILWVFLSGRCFVNFLWKHLTIKQKLVLRKQKTSVLSKYPKDQRLDSSKKRVFDSVISPQEIWVASHLKVTRLHHLQRKIIFQTSIIMFHVNFQSCKHKTSLKPTPSSGSSFLFWIGSCMM